MSNQHNPDLHRMSTLSAMVLLSIALTRLLPESGYLFTVKLAGFSLTLDFNLNLLMVIAAAGLSAAGVDWLLRSHPLLRQGQTVEHWLLPMLTTFILGVPLSQLESNTLWGGAFAAGGLLLILTFWAEYVVVSPGDTNYPLATAVLTVISFALYLILAIAMRYLNVRLLWMAPAIFAGAFLVSVRTLHLRLSGRWEFAWATGIALMGMQLSAGLHYWPVSPVRFGILLLGALYALISLAAGLGEKLPLRRALVEPLVMLALIWSMSIWVA